MTTPRISVVMPAYNRSEYIGPAIDSILMQSYKDFELIIVDDGSADNTVEIIKSYDDPRIRLIQHETNKGVAAARNTGYQSSRGEFIVVADSDDINEPSKLKKQIDLLDKHPDIDIVGCVYKSFTTKGFLYDWPTYEQDPFIRAQMLFWPGVLTASMFRKEKIKSLGVLSHNENFKAAVDYEWVNKMPPQIKFANILEPLYFYREHERQITSLQKNIQYYFVWYLRKENLLKLGVKLNEIDFQSHDMLADYSKFSTEELINNFSNLRLWCEKLIKLNKINKLYKEEAFIQIINDKFLLITNSIYYSCDKTIFAEWYKYKYHKEEYFPINILKLSEISRDKKIAIIGTLRLSAKIINYLEELDSQILYCIDNSNYSKEFYLNKYKLYSDEVLNNIPVDVLFISIESENRFLLKEKYQTLYPKMEVFTIDDIQ